MSYHMFNRSFACDSLKCVGRASPTKAFHPAGPNALAYWNQCASPDVLPDAVCRRRALHLV
eukprot:2886098-Rhodomonas_salina.1